MAVRTGSSTLNFLLGDHTSLPLSTGRGSTAITASSGGALSAELRYYAWGETRYASGTTPTTYRFTGQRQETLLGGADGLNFYPRLSFQAAVIEAVRLVGGDAQALAAVGFVF